MGVARHPAERQGGTLEGEGDRAVGAGPGRRLDAAVDVSCRARARARVGCSAWCRSAAQSSDGEETQPRLLGGAGDPRLVRDVDRRRRLPRRHRAVTWRFGPGALRGHGLPEPTTLGRFLRRFSLGHIGQLNRALDELFARVHPLVGRETVTLDLDATYIEHHGPVGSRQGTRGTYKGKICWHPLCCFVGETGEWLHAKLRNGHAGASTGATRFLAECLRRLPAGARLFLRADEGFWGQGFFADCERRQVTYAVGAPLIASVRGRISEIAE